MAASTAASSVVAVGAASRWWNRSSGSSLRVLSDDEYAFVQAISEAWMPPGGTPALSGADAEVGRFVDEVLGTVDANVARLLKLLMQVLDDKPIVGWGAPYRRLSLEARIQILQRWTRSEAMLFRNAVAGLMSVISFGWTNHPEVAATLRPLFGCGYGP